MNLKDIRLLPTLIIIVSVIGLATFVYAQTQVKDVFWAILPGAWMISELDSSGANQNRPYRQATVAFVGCLALALAIWISGLPILMWAILVIAWLASETK